VEKYPISRAKVRHDGDNIPTFKKNFFPYLAWVSADYVFFAKVIVTNL